MNNVRRDQIRELVISLEALYANLETIMYEETDYKDNIPENLQTSSRYETSETAVSALEDALSGIDDVISYCNSAIE